MLNVSPEDQAALEHHLQQAASILKQNTKAEKVKDFESIEVELTTQMLTRVSSTIAEFFGHFNISIRHPISTEQLAMTVLVASLKRRGASDTVIDEALSEVVGAKS